MPASSRKSHHPGKEEEQHTTESMSGKIFNDPIHGHIEIPPLCVKIIDTPQFQRLRSIKQVGGTYFVYPGGSHNRFEHSLGVCHLAGQLASSLRARQPDLGISDDDVMCVQIAGLCHDLGHGPFSHMFDNKFLPSIGKKTKHESLSVKMLRHMVKKKNKNNLHAEFKKCFPKVLDRNKNFIEELIKGLWKDESKGWPYKGRGEDKRFLYEIVANKRNGIDVDKWDYFARDCHMLGIKNSFDHIRCMKYARVLRVDGELQICFRDKEVENLYEMFHTRDVLYRRAYQHSVGNIIEIMISEAMQLADKYIKIPGLNGEVFTISGAIKDMEAYEKLTDSIVDLITISTDGKLTESKEILKKVRERQLYKRVGETRTVDTKTGKIVKEEYVKILKRNGSSLREEDVIIDVVPLNYGMKDKNPIDHVGFYKKEKPNEAFKIEKDEVSRMLPVQFSEQLVRFYCKKDDSASIKEAKQAMKEWCEENKCKTGKTVMQRYVEILEKNGSSLREEDVIVDVVPLNFDMKDKNPIDHVGFYKKENPNEEVNIEKDEVSRMVPVKFSEQLVQFYCKKDDSASIKEAKQAMKEWCEENKCNVIKDGRMITMTPVKDQ